MKKYVGKYEFVDEMSKKGNGFSWDGAGALFDHLEEIEDETGEEIEFDAASVRGDYSEYPSIIKAAEDCESGKEFDEQSAIEFFEDKTTVITFDGGVIIEVF